MGIFEDTFTVAYNTLRGPAAIHTYRYFQQRTARGAEGEIVPRRGSLKEELLRIIEGIAGGVWHFAEYMRCLWRGLSLLMKKFQAKLLDYARAIFDFVIRRLSGEEEVTFMGLLHKATGTPEDPVYDDSANQMMESALRCDKERFKLESQRQQCALERGEEKARLEIEREQWDEVFRIYINSTKVPSPPDSPPTVDDFEVVPSPPGSPPMSPSSSSEEIENGDTAAPSHPTPNVPDTPPTGPETPPESPTPPDTDSSNKEN